MLTAATVRHGVARFWDAVPVPAERARNAVECRTGLGRRSRQSVVASAPPSNVATCVVQEIWALMCAYQTVRDLTAATAALARQDPLRICFVNALDVVRGPVGQPGPFPLTG